MLEKLNYKVNKKVDLGKGYLNGQGLSPISECRYGLFSAGYNACEMIATFNLLKLNGYEGHEFAEICKEMYPKTWAFWGIFGSNVYTLHLYFKKRKIPYRIFYNMDDFFNELPSHKGGMLSMWNAHNPLKGIHTVCIEKTFMGYKVYNRSNGRKHPVVYTDPSQFVDKYRYMVGYVIKENKK